MRDNVSYSLCLTVAAGALICWPYDLSTEPILKVEEEKSVGAMETLIA